MFVGAVGEQFGIDLVVTKKRFFFILTFLPHGKPDVGVDDVGIPGGRRGIGGQGDVGSIKSVHEFLGRKAGLGSSDDKLKAEILGGPHPGAGHVVVTVADEDDLLAFPGAELLANGQKISQNLAGMFFIGEGVDGGNARVGVEVFHILLGKGSDDGTVNHAPQNACGVLDGFSPTELDIVFGEEHDITAQFADADFK